jgi:hypothetical protein
MKRLLRRLAWWIIQKTDSSDIPHVVFRHKCGSESVIPLGMYFPGWKEPAFECFGCNCITNKNIEARLVDPKDKKIIEKAQAGMAVLHPQY